MQLSRAQNHQGSLGNGRVQWVSLNHCLGTRALAKGFSQCCHNFIYIFKQVSPYMVRAYPESYE